jgi:hypothetical protein
MLVHTLLVFHIAVLGYWLGSELVINSTYRHVAWAADMPFEQRDRLMDHVMEADQHVRYALLLQLLLGFSLLFLMGYLPGGVKAAWLSCILGAAWLLLVELAHRRRKSGAGRRLASIDRGFRYLAMLTLAGLAVAALSGNVTLPPWVAWKLLAFVGVMAAGVGIRLVLIRYFVVWDQVGVKGSTAALESQLRALYWRATAILVGLWVFIGLAVWLSIAKPG